MIKCKGRDRGSCVATLDISARSKSFKTPLAEGHRIHYNFVKPHEGLEGRTPAQVAGIGIQAKNKWLAMLK